MRTQTRLIIQQIIILSVYHLKNNSINQQQRLQGYLHVDKSSENRSLAIGLQFSSRNNRRQVDLRSAALKSQRNQAAWIASVAGALQCLMRLRHIKDR